MNDNVAEAACREKWEIVRILVKNRGDVDATYSCPRYSWPVDPMSWYHGSQATALHYAAYHGMKEICELLLKRGARISATCLDGGQPLHWAAHGASAVVCQLLLDHGADVTAVNSKRQTPLFIAASSVPVGQKWTFCTPLITEGSVNVADLIGDTALHKAAELRDDSLTMDLLVSRGAHVNVLNKHGQTPLHVVTDRWNDHPELSKSLIKHGAKADAEDKNGNQPLHLACKRGHTETGSLLMSHEADANAVNKCGQTPLHIVADSIYDQPELSKSLIKHSAMVDAEDENGNQPLHLACERGHTETGSLLISHGADANAVNKRGQTPLHIVADSRFDHPELSKSLIKHSAMVDAEDENGNQPLHLVCERGHTETGSLLISHGADANAVNKRGQTPLHIVADSRSDHLELSKSLIEHSAMVDAEDENGNQPLHLVCERGHTEAGSLLISHGADANALNKRGQTPLHIVADSRSDHLELSKSLIEHSAMVDAEDENGNQPLHLVCERGHTEAGSLLISHGADANALNKRGQTPLHKVASGNNDCPKLCNNLLQHKARVNAEDCNGNQPLHLACGRGHTKTGSLLLSHGADANALNKHGQTPLHVAAGGEKECFWLCKSLVNHDAKVDTVDEDGDHPLHLACKRGHTEIRNLLVSHGADANAFNKHGQTPLHAAASGEKDCPELCENLIKHNAKIDAEDDNGNQPLHLACKRHHTETGNLLMSHGADANALNKDGRTPLHAAAGGEKECFLLCKSLVNHDAKVDTVDEDGDHPLHLACKRGHTEIGNLLVSHGADANAFNKHGQTPLHAAASGEKDCPELCENLIKHNAKIDAEDDNGNQPLHLACKRHHTETGNLLMSHGADANALNKDGRTPLHAAAGGEKECFLLCKSLVNHDAKVDTVDEDGDHPLHLACKRGHTEISNLLVSHGADANAFNKHGQTPLHAAASGEKDCPELCENLIKHNAKIDAEDDNGNQPLHLACKRHHTETGNLLMSHGADANALNKDGRTPLHAAAGGEKECFLLCKSLVNHDAKVDTVDEDGDHPLHLACKRGHTEIGNLLVSHGADANAFNKHGQTPLHAAASGEKDCPELCENLIKHNAKVDAVDEDGNQPLHLACDRGHTMTVNLLVSYDADVKAVNGCGCKPLFLISKHITIAQGRLDSDGNQPLHLACKHGMTTAVQLLVDLGADTNALNKRGQTPLHIIADREKDCPGLCEIFLKRDAKVNAVDNDGNQALHLACERRHKETCKLLLCHGADVTAVDRQKKRAFTKQFIKSLMEESFLEVKRSVDVTGLHLSSLLYWAVYYGQLQDVELLLKQGANPDGLRNGPDQTIFLTPLHVAADMEKDSPDLCEILLHHGCKVDACDDNGNRPLHLACKRRLNQTCKLLLFHGADVTTVDKYKERLFAKPFMRSVMKKAFVEIKRGCDVASLPLCSLLYWAVYYGRLQDVELLLEQGANPDGLLNGRTTFLTPLHVAADREKDSPDLCEILLHHGCKVDACDDNGNRPLHLACKRRLNQTCKLLLFHGADVTFVDQHKKRMFAKQFMKSVMEESFLKIKRDCDVARLPLCSLLYWAVHCGQLQDVELLLEKGASPDGLLNGRTIFLTPLHVAADKEKDSSDRCELLLHHSCKVDAQDENGNHPLHLACERGHVEAVKVLLSHRADVKALNNAAWTPLHAAAGGRKDCREVGEILLKHGAETDAVNENGNQPLHLACKRGHAATGILLVSNGADGKSLNNNGYSPLELINQFVLAMVSSEESERDVRYALHVAVERGLARTVQLLVDCGADVNAVNKHGQTPLHTAVNGEMDFPEMCEILLKCNAKIDAVDGVGKQPLHLACERGHSVTGILLMSYEADANVQTRDGRTPLRLLSQYLLTCKERTDRHDDQALHIALRHNMDGHTQLLVKCGADTNAVNKDGQTPLHVAADAENDSPELCKKLLLHDAKIDAVDKCRNQPLHLACRRGHILTANCCCLLMLMSMQRNHMI